MTRPDAQRSLVTGGPMANQRGMALVMAVLVLSAVLAMALVLMTSLNGNTKVVGYSVRRAQALNNAEAGIAEAISRIRSGDVPTALNPRMVTQVFLTPAGSVPALGVDSTGLATDQPPGQWMAYSTADRSTDALTIRYKTDAARTVIYKYDPLLNPPVQTASGVPIYEVTSAGRRGTTTRRVVTEIYPRAITPNVYGALTANADIQLSGNSVICGYDHVADTPTGKGANGRLLANGCMENPLADQWEIGGLLGGIFALPGVWTPFNVGFLGASLQFGTIPVLSNQTGFYGGPWDALGMTKEEFWGWVGSPSASAPESPNGITILDNNSTGQDQSGSFAFHGVNGEGLLYVDGDLTLNSSFNFRGMVYVEGDIKINGTAWILGTVICRGKTTVKITGGSTILYSRDAIIQTLARAGGQFNTLSWREKP
jgi:Tfp pilus assembly protein PilX